MEERQTNYTIAEGFTLPSGGKIYDEKVNPNIELRSMTARDEMKRQNPSAAPLKVLADIIEGCMLEKPAVHVYDMAFGDYEYLLHKLRIVTYGPNYKLNFECADCGNLNNTVIKLDDLDVKDFDIDEFESVRTFTLPSSGQEVSIKFQTPRMSDEIEIKAKEMRKRAKDADINFSIYAKLLTIIDTVDGKKLSPVDLDYFINGISARDMNTILNHDDKLNSLIGLNTTFTTTCSSCGEDNTMFFRFGQEFFRPSED